MSAPFDPAAAWDGLAPDMQRAFGVGAMTAVAGTILNEDATPGHEPGDTAFSEALGVLADLFTEHVHPEPMTGLIDLAAIGVRMCSHCGCTDKHGCVPHSCQWVGDNLCSACAPVKP